MMDDLDRQTLLVEINRLRAENERLRALVPEPDFIESLARCTGCGAIQYRGQEAVALAARIREQEGGGG